MTNSENMRDIDYPDVDLTCWSCKATGEKQNWCVTCDHIEQQCTCPEGYQHLWEINRCTNKYCRATW